MPGQRSVRRAGSRPLPRSRATGGGSRRAEPVGTRRSHGGQRQVARDGTRARSSRSRPTGSATWCWSGHAGRGKTTLVEALLVGHRGDPTRPGRVEDGTTVCDHEDVEHRLGRSVSLAVASAVHEGVKVNFVDTPGHADFVGEVRAGLRAADAALFVVSAVDGVDGITRMLWEECAAGRHAARGRRHPPRPAARRLRRGAGDLPAGLRRGRAAALPAAARTTTRRPPA